VEVTVKDSLSCDGTDVRADVKAFDCLIIGPQEFACFVQQVIARQELISGQREVVLGVTVRDDQRMKPSDRERVPKSVGKIIAQENTISRRSAKNAVAQGSVSP